MLQTLMRILESQNELSDWKIKYTKQEGEEAYIIGSKVDMIRAKDINRYMLTLYKDFTSDGINYKGSSTLSLHPSMKPAELEKSIKNGLENAIFVKNPYYPIVNPTQLKNVQKTMVQEDGLSSLNDLLSEIQEMDSEYKKYINSIELFTYQEKKTIMNSKGLHVSFEKPKIYIEIITQAKSLNEEVELYFEYNFSTIRKGYLLELLQNSITQTKDRALADSTPNLGKHAIILTGSCVNDLLSYYLSKSSSKAFYEKISHFKPGDSFQGNPIKGDTINLWLDPFIPNSFYNEPFDEDGYPLEKLKIIEDGSLIRYWGDTRFSYYVKAVPPTGGLKNIHIKGGEKSISDFKSAPYLEVVSFSDFQMDSITGDFGGEIRLGYYYDGSNTRPVTKGSIVGNILSCHQNYYLSKETQMTGNFQGPKSILLFDAVVSGY